MPPPEPTTLQYLALLATPCIALIVALITGGQLYIARQKLKLDLLEKRLDAAKTLREAISAVLSDGNSNRQSEVKLLMIRQDIRVLFTKRHALQVHDIYRDCVALWAASTRLNATTEQQLREQSAAAAERLIKSISDKYDALLEQLYSYMAVRTWPSLKR